MICRETIAEVFESETEVLTTKEVTERVYANHPDRPWQRNTIQVTLTGLTINHPSSRHHPHLRAHSFLFSPERGRYRRWDPERDGQWAVVDNRVQRVDSEGAVVDDHVARVHTEEAGSRREESMSDPVKVEKEDARVGYQVAVDFWTYQGKLIWDRFNVMLVACSIITGLVSAIFSYGQQIPAIIIIGLAAVGLVLCCGWFLIMASGFAYHKYWGLCAWDLEERYLKGTVDTVAKLQVFREGPVEFERIGRSHARGRFERTPQNVIAYVVILAFTVAFIASFVEGIRRGIVIGWFGD